MSLTLLKSFIRITYNYMTSKINNHENNSIRVEFRQFPSYPMIHLEFPRSLLRSNIKEKFVLCR